MVIINLKPQISNLKPHMRRRVMTAVLLSILWVGCKAQTYSLEQVNDSLSFLTLTTDGHTDRYRLPWPTLRWCTGDVDGDGVEDAMVMVVKRTRFDKRVLPRLFTFTQKNGRVRPLWLGSQLGGILEDFRFVDGQVITLQRTTDYRYVVMTHRWRKFGLGADSILVEGVDREIAETYLNLPQPSQRKSAQIER